MALVGEDLLSFGALLKVFRRRSHLSQEQLAGNMGVHRNTIERWEEGDFLPKNKGRVLELARYLRLNDPEARQLLEASFTTLAPLWGVPLPRNPFFTGREAVLEVLHGQLGMKQAVVLMQSSALYGLGGVGKTQIALEYAYRYELEYSAVFWLGAESGESVVASLLHIAEVLQLPERENKDQQQVVAAVQRWFTTHSQWLLIWDNVEDLDMVNHFLPLAHQGAILLTTRRQTLGTLAQGMNLLPMEHEEGILFLLRRAKMLTPEATREEVHQFAEYMPGQYAAAEELVAFLGGLPLALDQAGAYLEATQCGLVAYLDLFCTRRAALLQRRGEGAHDHPESVSTTFTLAILATAQRHQAAWDLLRVCALLQPDAIPEELFLCGGKYLGAALDAAGGDRLEWDQLVAVVCACSLLSRQPEDQTLSLHRLVQAVLLDIMTEDERELWVQRIVGALEYVFPNSEHANWKQCERLLPHALLSLDYAAKTEGSITQASLAHKVAHYLLDRVRYAEAESLYQRVLYVRERILGPDHREVACTLNELAAVCLVRGKYAEAEPLCQRALQLWKKTPDLDQPDRAFTLSRLAIIYGERSEYTEAEAHCKSALQIWERVLGPDHPDVARAFNNLAAIYWMQGRYKDAEAPLQCALQTWERALGPDHPDLALPLSNLAELYIEQGRYTEAEPLCRRALRAGELIQGPEHPNIALSLNNLAELSIEQGRYTEAESCYLRALQICEQVLGPDHPRGIESINGLAKLCRELGRFEEAEWLYQRALRIQEQVRHPEHPDVAIPLNGLANLYRDQDKSEEAEAFYQRALRIQEQHLDQYHPKTAQTLYDLAIFRRKQRNLREAIALVERALKICVRTLGDAYPRTVATRALYAQLVQEQRRAEEEKSAAPLVEENEKSNRLWRQYVLRRIVASPQTTVNSSSSEDDPLQGFLTCCELHPRAWSQASDLWQAYERWTEEHQERFPLSRRAFIAQLKAHGCYADRTSTVRIWRGIALIKEKA